MFITGSLTRNEQEGRELGLVLSGVNACPVGGVT